MTESSTVGVTTQSAHFVHQVIEGSSEAVLEADVKPETKQAVTILPINIQTSVEDVQIAYKEKPLDDFLPAQHQTARPVSDERKTVQVKEIHAAVRESPLETLVPKEEKAKTHLPVSEAPVIVEHSVMDFTSPHTASQVTSEMPTVAVTPHNAFTVEQHQESSVEEELSPAVVPEAKQAARVLPQYTETAVADVQVAFKEEPLKDFVTGQTQTARAVPEVRKRKNVQITEVHSEVSETPLDMSLPKGEVAKCQQQSVEAAVVQVQETTTLDYTTEGKIHCNCVD